MPYNDFFGGHRSCVDCEFRIFLKTITKIDIKMSSAKQISLSPVNDSNNPIIDIQLTSIHFCCLYIKLKSFPWCTPADGNWRPTDNYLNWSNLSYLLFVDWYIFFKSWSAGYWKSDSIVEILSERLSSLPLFTVLFFSNISIYLPRLIRNITVTVIV